MGLNKYWHADNNCEKGCNFIVIIFDIYKAAYRTPWDRATPHLNRDNLEAGASEQGPYAYSDIKCQ